MAAASLVALTPVVIASGPQASAAESTLFGFNHAVGDQGNQKQITTLQQQLNVNGCVGEDAGQACVRRIIVRWSRVEPTEGNWDWTYFDAGYDLVLQNNLTPQIVVHGAPCWANPGDPDCVPGTNGNTAPDPAHDAQWREFVRRATDRYPAAIGVEVWNEPNGNSNISPERYTQILQVAHGAVKSVNSVMPVISGGLQNFRRDDCSKQEPICYPAYLTRMFDNGAASYMDGIGIHPYPIVKDDTPLGCWKWDPNEFDVVLGNVRGVRDQHGGNQPIWVTETGIGTAPQFCTAFAAGVSPAVQADYLQQIVNSAIAAPDVPVLLIHNLVDDNVYNFGIYDTFKNPKPAACKLSEIFGGTLSC